MILTCSCFRPGGTQVYSSSGQPLSSSDTELRLTSWINLFKLRSWSLPLAISWASGGHLQWRHIFLEKQNKINMSRSAPKNNYPSYIWNMHTIKVFITIRQITLFSPTHWKYLQDSISSKSKVKTMRWPILKLKNSPLVWMMERAHHLY